MEVKLNKDGIPEMLDQRDTAHNAGFVGLSLFYQGQKDLAEKVTEPIKRILWKILWPFKNPSYWWSNSGSNTTTWKNGFTYKIYHGFLKYFPFKVKSSSPQNTGGWDIRKGLNGDQCSPMLAYFSATKQYWQLIKFMLGMWLRASILAIPAAYYTFIGIDHWIKYVLMPFYFFLFMWYPNFEPGLLKISHWSFIFRVFHLKPFYWFTDIIFFISCIPELKKPIQDASNKVRMYLYLAQAEKQSSTWTKEVKERIRKTSDYKKWGSFKEYFKKIFKIYFSGDDLKSNTINKMGFNLVKE